METALAGPSGSDDELASEAADLIYHLSVLLWIRRLPGLSVVDVLKLRSQAR